MNETTHPGSGVPQPSFPIGNAPDVAPAETGPALSEVTRLVDTFVAPAKTFSDIRRCSRWWLPFLVSVLVSYVFVYAVEQKVGWDQVVTNVVKQTPKQQERFAAMEPMQAAEARQTMANSYRYFSWGFPLLTLIVASLSAAVLLATVNFGFGGEATFGRMFAVWMYGTLPLAIKGLLGALVLFAGMSPEQFNLQNAAGTNVGYYLPSDMNKGLITLASSIDIFTIWTVVLLIIGCSIVARISRVSAAIAVVGWWAIMVLASVAGAVVNS
jgi:hypothetical protein